MEIIGREHTALFSQEKLRRFRGRLRTRPTAVVENIREENSRLAAANTTYQRTVDTLTGRIRRLENNLHQSKAQTREAIQIQKGALRFFVQSCRKPVRGAREEIRSLQKVHGRQLNGEAQAQLQRAAQRLDETHEKIASLALYLQILEAPVQPQHVSVVHLVERILGEFAWEYAGRSVEVRQSSLPDCCADPELLRSVYRILLSNAFKFTRPRGGAVIEIAHLNSSRGMVWYVRDNGVGFRSDQKHLLFEPFRGPRCRREERGASVSFAAARKIVESHGGRIWAEGEENRGATFYFTLGDQTRGS